MSDDQASHDAFKWKCRRNHIESLRIPWEGMGAMANTERNIAALMNTERNIAALMIENLMDEVEAWKQAMQKAERDIAQLRAERDEARREVCVLMQQTGFLRGDYANERGWDCFKEKTNDC